MGDGVDHTMDVSPAIIECFNVSRVPGSASVYSVIRGGRVSLLDTVATTM